MDFLTNETQILSSADIVTSLDKEDYVKVISYLESLDNKISTNETPDLELLLSQYEQDDTQYAALIKGLPIEDSHKYESGFDLFKHKIPMWIFLIVLLGLTVWSYKENLSLIPLLGLICCLYMMAELSVWNWIYFTIWLLIGLIIYFSFSRKNSKLNILKS
jgi:hypothetical protein